jgi:hypothetical protein
MEPKSSLSCSQDLATDIYPEPDIVNPDLTLFFIIIFLARGNQTECFYEEACVRPCKFARNLTKYFNEIWYCWSKIKSSGGLPEFSLKKGSSCKELVTDSPPIYVYILKGILLILLDKISYL